LQENLGGVNSWDSRGRAVSQVIPLSCHPLAAVEEFRHAYR
jgi:hypothetical protein